MYVVTYVSSPRPGILVYIAYTRWRNMQIGRILELINAKRKCLHYPLTHITWVHIEGCSEPLFPHTFRHIEGYSVPLFPHTFRDKYSSLKGKLARMKRASLRTFHIQNFILFIKFEGDSPSLLLTRYIGTQSIYVV